MAFRLRYQAHDQELAAGEFVVGRSAECQLSLDDPLVSRRHALFRIGKGGVTVQDLGSRNGVLVNGVRIDGERALAAGDKLSIGSQDMTFHASDDADPLSRAGGDDPYRRATQTLGAGFAGDLRAAMDGTPVDPPTTSDTSRGFQSFRLLAGVADKALALGRAEEAERILQAVLLDILNRAHEGEVIEPSMAEAAARYAARLGGATTKGSWVDYVFDLYTLAGRPIPAPVVDELYTVVRKVKSIDLARLRSYLADLRHLASSHGPAERFLVQRIDGLERLVALK